jgi:hypothetical protein
MAVHINIPASAIALARDICASRRMQGRTSSRNWVHLLHGDGVEDTDDSQHVAVFKFVSSAAS